ncbi:MAG: hypothetical protein ACI90V_005087, partial [Bacillariaceae sp.]
LDSTAATVKSFNKQPTLLLKNNCTLSISWKNKND